MSRWSGVPQHECDKVHGRLDVARSEIMMQSERSDVIDDVDRDKGSGACPVYETTNEMHVTESATA